jgi:hypothetical protein
MPDVKDFCRICGKYDYLTDEHVPPKRAFNKNRYMVGLMNDDDPLGEPIKKAFRQGGIKFKTLCKKCNNDTGGWYGGAYVSWCLLAFDILRLSNGKPSLHYVTSIFPLRIIKQIIVMFFSLNEHFRESSSYLVRFVMNKELKNLPLEFRLFAYYNFKGNPRYSPISTVGDFSGKNAISTFTELTYPPFGFVLTINDSPPTDKQYRETTHFADYDYDIRRQFDLNLNALETWLPIPGDYRSYDKIQEDLAKNKKNGSQQLSPHDAE